MKNIKESPITSIIGALLILIALANYIVPMFAEVKSVIQDKIAIGMAVLGLALLFCPDDIVSLLKSAIESLKNLFKRKSEEL